MTSDYDHPTNAITGGSHSAPVVIVEPFGWTSCPTWKFDPMACCNAIKGAAGEGAARGRIDIKRCWKQAAQQ